MNDRVSTNSPTPTEKLALKTANAALLESNDAFCDMVATVVFALSDAQLLQSPETADELKKLRNRVAELETATTAVGALHEKCANSDHCRYDSEPWPCQTVSHLQRPGLMAEQKHLMDKLDHALEALAPRTKDVSPQVHKLRGILAGQRAALEDPHESPLHREYKDCRDLPTPGGVL